MYTSCDTREQYKLLFDELQLFVEKLTGKQLRFKRLLPSSNLIAMIVDLEAAQILGASDSFLPTIDPAHSGIHTDDVNVLIPEFVRACLVHVQR